jgi:hypothetical protein
MTVRPSPASGASTTLSGARSKGHARSKTYSERSLLSFHATTSILLSVVNGRLSNWPAASASTACFTLSGAAPNFLCVSLDQSLGLLLP